jgi:hypothetical protein
VPTYLIGDRLLIADQDNTVPLSDVFSLSDASVLANSLLVPLSDTFSFSDGILLAVPTRQLLSDTLGLTDSVRFATFGRGFTLSDSFRLSDSIQTSRTQATPISDALAVSDTLSVILSLAIGIFDSLTLSDGVAAPPISIFLVITQTVSDFLLLSDSISYASQSSLVALGDSVLLCDGARVILNSTTISYLRRYLNDVC